MNVHSLRRMSSRLDPPTDRREQILRAAMICFARRGFHQASMHDISAEAGISVGLIYRYFENKDAVISAIADQHKQRVQELLERARQAPTLLEALEVLFTEHCCDNTPQVISAFVVDLFAEAGRNPRVADLVRDVTTTAMKGVTELIAKSPEALAGMQNMSPRELAELIFALNDGMLMRDVLAMHRPPEQIRERQLKVARNLWRLLFSHSSEGAIA
ncbi:MAG: TetR/AcrR family transcriptional regulator [Chthoniobacterales bacterium]|nr:TetR/AcrR family transcriptional regulator [Chthoniobacterales bacterium]